MDKRGTWPWCVERGNNPESLGRGAPDLPMLDAAATLTLWTNNEKQRSVGGVILAKPF